MTECNEHDDQLAVARLRREVYGSQEGLRCAYVFSQWVSEIVCGFQAWASGLVTDGISVLLVGDPGLDRAACPCPALDLENVGQGPQRNMRDTVRQVLQGVVNLFWVN